MKGATSRSFALSLPRRFNSRSREGSDKGWGKEKPPSFHVSIHAPVKGATSSALCLLGLTSRFNSRSREGSDSDNRSTPPRHSRFNSRSREGSDYRRARTKAMYSCFNSRSREGSDLSTIGDTIKNTRVSIHAPVKGATKALAEILSSSWKFQFTLP